MFKALKLTDEEIEAKFGFLVEAYKYGAPHTVVWVSVLTESQCYFQVLKV